jgi:hypothetical protein
VGVESTQNLRAEMQKWQWSCMGTARSIFPLDTWHWEAGGVSVSQKKCGCGDTEWQNVSHRTLVDGWKFHVSLCGGRARVWVPDRGSHGGSPALQWDRPNTLSLGSCEKGSVVTPSVDPRLATCSQSFPVWGHSLTSPPVSSCHATLRPQPNPPRPNQILLGTVTCHRCVRVFLGPIWLSLWVVGNSLFLVYCPKYNLGL